jgi:hypothetical protein
VDKKEEIKISKEAEDELREIGEDAAKIIMERLGIRGPRIWICDCKSRSIA